MSSKLLWLKAVSLALIVLQACTLTADDGLYVWAESRHGGTAYSEGVMHGRGRMEVGSSAMGPGSTASSVGRSHGRYGGYVDATLLSVADHGGTARAYGEFDAVNGGFVRGNVASFAHGGNATAVGSGSAEGPAASTFITSRAHSAYGYARSTADGNSSSYDERYPAEAWSSARAEGIDGGISASRSTASAMSEHGRPAKAYAASADYARGSSYRGSSMPTHAWARSYGGTSQATAVRCR